MKSGVGGEGVGTVGATGAEVTGGSVGVAVVGAGTVGLLVGAGELVGLAVVIVTFDGYGRYKIILSCENELAANRRAKGRKKMCDTYLSTVEELLWIGRATTSIVRVGRRA